MSTLTCPRPAVNRKPRTVRAAHGVIRLTIAINGTAYAVRPLAIEPGSGVVRLVRLRKADGTHYNVHRDDTGHCGCDCPSFEFDRRQNDNGPCKHIAALSACGLL